LCLDIIPLRSLPAAIRERRAADLNVCIGIPVCMDPDVSSDE